MKDEKVEDSLDQESKSEISPDKSMFLFTDDEIQKEINKAIQAVAEFDLALLMSNIRLTKLLIVRGMREAKKEGMI